MTLALTTSNTQGKKYKIKDKKQGKKKNGLGSASLITNYSQQDATFLEFISTDALHVSGGSSAHHQ
jgi:hypothetical protein